MNSYAWINVLSATLLATWPLATYCFLRSFETREARWAVARPITGEIAAESGVTDADREWAASVLGLDDLIRI